MPKSICLVVRCVSAWDAACGGVNSRYGAQLIFAFTRHARCIPASDRRFSIQFTVFWRGPEIIRALASCGSRFTGPGLQSTPFTCLWRPSVRHRLAAALPAISATTAHKVLPELRQHHARQNRYWLAFTSSRFCFHTGWKLELGKTVAGDFWLL